MPESRGVDAVVERWCENKLVESMCQIPIRDCPDLRMIVWLKSLLLDQRDRKRQELQFRKPRYAWADETAPPLGESFEFRLPNLK